MNTLVNQFFQAASIDGYVKRFRHEANMDNHKIAYAICQEALENLTSLITVACELRELRAMGLDVRTLQVLISTDIDCCRSQP